MRKLLSLLALVGALVSLGAAVTAAAPSKVSVQLKPPAGTHMMAITHAFGSATISYTAHDADIKLTADKLPKPGAIHEKVYVLWSVKGKHKLNVGGLKVHRNMAGLHKMIMDTTFTQLVVTGEQSVAEKAPMGPKVLSGTVMHH